MDFKDNNIQNTSQDQVPALTGADAFQGSTTPGKIRI